VAQVICAADHVHVWRIDLDCTLTKIISIAAVLSEDERVRANRFRTPQLCRRWTAAHVALRNILATYCDIDPRNLIFRAGEYGKPELAWPKENVTFNLSHSGRIALAAVARERRVGVDLEMIRHSLEIEDLARRYFAPSEVSEILAVPLEARINSFFMCWTRKEAFIKALGSGLSLPLHRFRVSVTADQPASLLSTDWDEAGVWNLTDLSEKDFRKWFARAPRSAT